MDQTHSLYVFLSFVVSAGVTLFSTPLVIRWAKRKGWMAMPKEDRWHRHPTALMGGIAIFVGCALGSVMGGSLELWWIGVGCLLMFLLGVYDDLWSLSPMAKLVAQVGIASIPLLAGFTFGISLPWLAVPLTLLWVIGVTNAFNLIDGMDGLAAGLAMIASSVLAILALLQSDWASASLALALSGACAAFLMYNYHPARIFMGDGGSLFLGFALACIALKLQSNVSGSGMQIALMVSPIAILSIPIIDTTLVTFMRLAHGRPVSQGGNDHIMHRLSALGLTERRTVLMLWGCGAAMGGVGLALYLVEAGMAWTLGIFACAALLVLLVHASSADVYRVRDTLLDPALRLSTNRFAQLAHSLLGQEWKSIAGLAADLVLMSNAFVLAFLLRYEDGLTAEHISFIQHSLPIVLAVKISVFYLMHLYRGIWRYAGTPEVMRIGVASGLASGIAYVVLSLVFGADSVSFAVLFIDCLLATIAAAGVRLGLRGLRGFIMAQPKKGYKRVALYGAGDVGLLSLRALRQEGATHALLPVAFFDDDPLKLGMSVQGLRVVGGINDIKKICVDMKVDEILITSGRMSAHRKQIARTLCGELGISIRSFTYQFGTIANEDVVVPRLYVGSSGSDSSLSGRSLPSFATSGSD